jgi:hypothetical protein
MQIIQDDWVMRQILNHNHCGDQNDFKFLSSIAVVAGSVYSRGIDGERRTQRLRRSTSIA